MNLYTYLFRKKNGYISPLVYIRTSTATFSTPRDANAAYDWDKSKYPSAQKLLARHCGKPFRTTCPSCASRKQTRAPIAPVAHVVRAPCSVCCISTTIDGYRCYAIYTYMRTHHQSPSSHSSAAPMLMVHSTHNEPTNHRPFRINSIYPISDKRHAERVESEENVIHERTLE